MSRKASTFITGPRHKPLRSPMYEAAKFVRDMANDYLRERSGPNPLTDAVEMWLAEVRKHREMLAAAPQQGTT